MGYRGPKLDNYHLREFRFSKKELVKDYVVWKFQNFKQKNVT